MNFSDDTVFNAEITEIPVEIYPHCYAVKTGEDVILMKYIRSEVEKLKQTGYVKVRGVIKEIGSASESAAAAERYFIDNGIYSAEDSKKFSGLYLDCSDIDFIDKMKQDHPFGVLIGLTLLIAWLIVELDSRSLNAVKNLRPACGSVRYSHREIDDQANLPDSKWIRDNDVYITPKIIIGLNRGLTAVEYTDIKKIYVKKEFHTESKPSRKIYYSYKVIAKTANNKRLAICENRVVSSWLKAAITEKCGSDIWTE